jgi:hypothetical protein
MPKYGFPLPTADFSESELSMDGDVVRGGNEEKTLSQNLP